MGKAKERAQEREIYIYRERLCVDIERVCICREIAGVCEELESACSERKRERERMFDTYTIYMHGDKEVCN